MVYLEHIKSNDYLSIKGVIQEAMKIGNLKNLDEAVKDNHGAVVVAKVRDTLATVKGDPKLRLSNVRQLLLKEVCKDGSYGSKFKAVLYGDVVLDTELADLCIGDRLIFVQPSIVLISMYDSPAEIYPYQLECGLPAHKNQRLLLIKKKCTLSNMANESKETELNGKIKSNGKLSNDERPTVSNQPFTTSFTEKQIVGSNLKVVNSVMINHKNSKKVLNKFKYVYKKVADIKEAESKVNMYVVVSELLKVQTAGGTRKHTVTFKGVDETCKDKEHLVICTLFDESDMYYELIKPSIVLRLHRMQINEYNNFFEGKVFRGSDLLIFVPNKKGGCTATTSAKTFTFTNEDIDRVAELQKWLKTVDLPSLTYREVEWQTLNSMRPERTFQMHCRIVGVTIHPTTNILVLHVCDGLYSPLKLYQVPVKEDHWTEAPEHFKTNLRTVDVIVECPSEKILILEKGTFIVLGPIKLNQCQVDMSGPNCYKMELQQKENIKILKSQDPAIKKIEKRFADDPINNNVNNLQDQGKKIVNSEMPVNKNTQKEGVFKEKRKLFNVNDNFDHSKAKKKKIEPSTSSEIFDNSTDEKQNQPSKDVRIKSPFEDDIFFNWTKCIPSDVYAEQSNGSQILMKSSDANPSKQMLNLKRKISNKYLKVPDVHKNPQVPAEETGENEKSDKTTLMSELKTKRIDTMSQESVDKYFEELGTMLTKYVTPRNKSSSPGSEVDKTVKPKEIPNSEINQVEVYPISSSTSSSSVIVMDEDKKSEDKTLNQPLDKPALDNINEDNNQEKTLVLKLVQLPPGQKSRVIVQDNVVQVEMDHKGRVNDAEHITLLSLFEGQLGKKITTIQNGDNTIPTPEKDKDSPRKNLNKKCKSKTFGTETKSQIVDMSVTDQFILNKFKINKPPSEKKSCITKTTVKKTINKTLNSLNNSHRNVSLDIVDLCDANTIINEKVKHNKPLELLSVATSYSSTMTVNPKPPRNNVLKVVECPSSLNSVRDWLEKTDFPPPIVRDKDEQDALNEGSPGKFGLLKPESDLLKPYVGLSKIKVFLMDVQPVFREEPMDLSSGYCSTGCHKLYLFSTLIFEHPTKSALCPECSANGEKKEVELMFALQLTVMDLEGYQFTVLLFREHAEQLLGCTIKQYVHHITTRKRVIKFLSTLKYDINKTFIPIMTMCASPIDSQVIVSNTKILYEKRLNKS